MREPAHLSRHELAAALPIAALTKASSVASDAGPHDGELTALGAQFEDAWRSQVATFDRLSLDMSDAAGQACDAAYDVTMAIVAQIEATTATSLAGVIVKARACSWCHSGEPFELDSFSDQLTTDKRLAATMIRDLLAISGKPTPEGLL